MKKNMPTLKELYNSGNKTLEDHLFGFAILYSMGYTAEDFKAFADEILADECFQATLELARPIVERALKNAVRK